MPDQTPLNTEALEEAFEAVEHPAVTRNDMEDIVSDAVSAYLAADYANAIQEAKAEALEEAATAAFNDKGIQGLRRVLIGNWLRARAEKIKEGLTHGS